VREHGLDDGPDHNHGANRFNFNSDDSAAANDRGDHG
jgi:hypothetical protein